MGHFNAPPPGEQGREHFGIEMQVVVRVHMRGRGADELNELHLLTFNLGKNVFRIDAIQLEGGAQDLAWGTVARAPPPPRTPAGPPLSSCW